MNIFKGVSFINASIIALFIFNAGGVRLINNSLITVVIILLLLAKIQMNRRFDLKFFFVSTFLTAAVLFMNYVLTNLGQSPVNHIVLLSYLVSSAALVAIYRAGSDNFALDLRMPLLLFAVHAFFGFVLQFVVEPKNHISFLEIRDIAWMFFYPKIDTFSFIHRNCGLFWEPGVLQLFMNILLFLSLFVYKNKWLALLSILIIISTVSTVGFVIMAFQISYYLYLGLNKRTIIFLPFAVFFVIILGWLTMINVGEKMENKSSSVRMFDLAVGLEIVKENPVLGVGVNGKHFVHEVSRVGGGFQKLFHISDEELEGKGLTNGWLYLSATLGVPMVFLFLLFLYKQQALPNSIVLLMILLLTGFSEPIVQTGFYFVFLMFGLSTMLGSKMKRVRTYYAMVGTNYYGGRHVSNAN